GQVLATTRGSGPTTREPGSSTAEWSSGIRLLDPNTLQDLPGKFEAPLGSPNLERIALSPDHCWLAAVTFPWSRLQVWHIPSGRIVPGIEGLKERIQSVALSSNLLAIGGRRGVFRVSKLAENKVLTARPGEESPAISALVFSPDGRSLALAK